MASSRRAGGSETIRDYEGNSPDYTEGQFSVWEAATDNALGSGTEVLEVYAEGGGGALWDDAGGAMDGATSSDIPRIVRAADGEGHSGIPLDDGSCAGFDLTGGSIYYGIRVSEAGSHLQDLVGQWTVSSTGSGACFSSRGTGNFFIGLLVRFSNNTSSGQAHGIRGDSSATVYVVNCLIQDCKTIGIEVQTGTCYVYNTTSINNTNYGLDLWAGATTTAKNVLATDNGTDYLGTYDTSATCGDGDGSGPTGGAYSNLSPSYVNVAGDDFHLQSGDGVDIGTDLSSDGAYPFDDDIDFATRSGTWDIGFDEITAAPPASVTAYPQSATTATDSGTGHEDDDWVNPTNIYADDGNTASITAPSFDNGDQSYLLKGYNFDFSSIPAGSTIDGVVCNINTWYANNTGSIDYLKLLDTSGAPVGDNQCSTPVALTTDTATIVTKGAADSHWGNSLTLDWIQNSNFGLAVGMIATANNCDVFVDYVTLTVYYTESGAAQELTISGSAHSHAVEATQLSAVYQLNSGEVLHSHIADKVDLTATYHLFVYDALHGLSSDSLNLIPIRVLALLGSSHTLLSDAAVLTAVKVLLPAETQHILTSNEIALTYVAQLDTVGSVHLHGVEPPGLTYLAVLNPAGGSHAHESDILDLTYTAQLYPSGALHDHSVDSINIDTIINLIVSDVLHGHFVDKATLTAILRLFTSDVLHGHTADEAALKGILQLYTSGALHGHVADKNSLTATYQLTTSESAHSHAVERISLLRICQLSVADALHLHFADGVTIQLSLAQILVVSDAVHAHSAGHIVTTILAQLFTNEGLHLHTADEISPSILAQLSADESIHLHTVESPSTTIVVRVSPEDSIHIQWVDGVSLSLINQLILNGAIHIHSVDSTQLSILAQLSAVDALHIHTADQVELTAVEAGWTDVIIRGTDPITGKHYIFAGKYKGSDIRIKYRIL